MRKLFIALVALAGLALLAPTGAMAAPVNGAVIDAAANEMATVTDVSYRRHHCCHRWHHRHHHHRWHHRHHHHKCWHHRHHHKCWHHRHHHHKCWHHHRHHHHCGKPKHHPRWHWVCRKVWR